MNAFSCLANGAIAETDDRERGKPRAQIDLDRDVARLEARDGEGGDVSEHGGQPRRGDVPGEPPVWIECAACSARSGVTRRILLRVVAIAVPAVTGPFLACRP